MINDHIHTDTAQRLQQLLADSNVERYADKSVAAYIVLQLRRDDIDSHQDIIDEINNKFDLKTKTQRLMDWRSGVVPCPKRIASYIRQYILQYVFADEAADALMMLLNLER